MSKSPMKDKTSPNMAEKACQEPEDEDPLSGLSPRQDRALQALLQEPTIGRAATAAGISERTLYRWMHEPIFRTALLAARREAFGQAIGLTQKYAPVAVATLVKVMQDNTVQASAKVTAAAVLLKFGREGIELDDLADRVEALERAASLTGMPTIRQLEDKR